MNSKLSLLDAIKAVLSDDLLKPQYRCLTNKHITTGHCYAASEALYHIFGSSLNWIPVCGRDETGTHWWLKSRHTNEILDITSEQFTFFGKKPPYENSRPCGFLTKQPSKRAKTIINRLIDMDLQVNPLLI